MVQMVKVRKFLYAKPFEGEPSEDNFKLVEVEEKSPELKAGEIFCEGQYWSVDPYMRAYMKKYPEGSVMIGGQIARVLQSKHPNFPEGSLIYGHFGWQTHTLVKPDEVMDPFGKPYVLPTHLEKLSPSLGLGVIGMPGNTAYFGLEICQPKSGETVVITTAAGAVGSLVGQLAKLKGCRVIGFAGSDQKCEWLKKQLRFDFAFNYKTVDVAKVLREAAPYGVDCFFDNVGGEISTSITMHMNTFGRIALCGCAVAYNAKELPKATIIQPAILGKQLKMEGFSFNRWLFKWSEGLEHMLQLLKDGKLQYRETVTSGFENMPFAFMEMLKGNNIGKAIVKAKL